MRYLLFNPTTSKVLYVALAALCLFRAALAGCPESWTDNIVGYSGIDCIQCLPGCKECNSESTCDDLLDSVDGASIDLRGAIAAVCSSTDGHAYNKEDETCDSCAEGCSSCLYDKDICTSCKVGWDYNRDGRDCLRATLGLAAVNFIFAVTIAAAGILTCIKAHKLG